MLWCPQKTVVPLPKEAKVFKPAIQLRQGKVSVQAKFQTKVPLDRPHTSQKF